MSPRHDAKIRQVPENGKGVVHFQPNFATKLHHLLYLQLRVPPVLARRASHVLLDITPVGRLVREVERVGYLLDTHLRIGEVVLAKVDGEQCNPLQGRFPGLLLDDTGEVVGRDV